MLIDVDESHTSPHHLRYTLSNGENSAVKLLFKVKMVNSMDTREVDPGNLCFQFVSAAAIITMFIDKMV